LPILARVLRNGGLVTERQIQEAIRHQVLYGGRLGTSLYELGFITEERLRQALSRAHGVPTTAVDPREIDPEAVALLSKATVARYKIFPYKIRGKTLFLLMVDPQDHAALAKVGFSHGYIVRPLVVPEFRMIQLLRDHYGVDERWRYDDTHRPPVLPPVPVDRETAVARIESGNTRDEIVEATLALCQSFFRRVLFFIVREPWVLGWGARGEGFDVRLASVLRIPLDTPSVFQGVTRDKTVFLGRLGPEDENRRFLEAIGKSPNTSAAVFPITLKGRVVNLVYGDAGPSASVKADLGQLLALVQKVPRAYLRIIRRRIAESRKVAEGGLGANERESG
jgi:type II secretion system (T2SS) protein E